MMDVDRLIEAFARGNAIEETVRERTNPLYSGDFFIDTGRVVELGGV